ncbi:hypothetical protein DL93DRAFT_351060 [Clavulina sp. PMI_390]|nr:hypothetical protein DL93DRAFT_351060 [Clavulina sp. PMI_390]
MIPQSTTSPDSLPLLPRSTCSPETSTIQAIFSLLDNVKQLSVVQVDRSLLWTYYPHFTSSPPAKSHQEEAESSHVVEPLAQTVLEILEDWAAKPTLRELSIVNVSCEALTRFLKGLSSLSFLSVTPPTNEALIWHNPQPLVLPALRTLRTSIHWAQTFLSSVSPTHTLVLFDTEPYRRNFVTGSRLRQLPSLVRILQVEETSLSQLALMMMDLKRSGPRPNLSVIISSCRTLEEQTLHVEELPIHELHPSFYPHASIHTCVLRVTHYSHVLWTSPEIPRAFARKLASKLAKLEGRTPLPRVIVELGILGTPDFICWIFTMESRDFWTFQKEVDPVQDAIEREDRLYLTRI